MNHSTALACTLSVVLAGLSPAVAGAAPARDNAASPTRPGSSVSEARIERPAIAVPPSGRPVLAYREPVSGEVHVATCRNTRCTGPFNTRALAGLPPAGEGLAMAIGDNGHPVLSYRIEANAALGMTICESADCSIAIHMTLDDATQVGQHTSIAVAPDGRPTVSYHDEADARIRVASCSDARCSSATLTTLDWYLAGPHSSVAIGTDGFAGVAFQDEQGALLLARCSTADCSSTISINMVDGSSAGAGFEPTVHFGADGRPALSYLASAPRKVTFAHCADAACAQAAVTEIDAMGPDDIALDSPAFVFGSNGQPVVAYRRGDARLMLAECGDPGCTDGNRRAIKGAHAGTPGIAIAIGSDGRPLVAYVDDSSGAAELRVAR